MKYITNSNYIVTVTILVTTKGNYTVIFPYKVSGYYMEALLNLYAQIATNTHIFSLNQLARYKNGARGWKKGVISHYKKRKLACAKSFYIR